VELGDDGETGLEHLRVGQGRDGLEMPRLDSLQELVHALAPAPEAVLSRAALLRQASHRALEGVAVHVRQAWYGDEVEPLGGVGRRARLDQRNQPRAVDLDADVPGPAAG
jgi:hypothetical protein